MSLDDTSPLVTPLDVTGPAPGIALSSTTLSRVIADAPSAVLLVDLDGGRVVYANELARQLAPGLQLPVDVSRWSERAGLRNVADDELEASLTPLARVAAGHPVNGETVTALRSSDVSDARELLWIIGTPMTDAPGPLGRQALVVLLPLRDADAIAQARTGAADLRHRAVIASQLSFSISDPTVADNPLVWVNPAFERTTGYMSDDVIGHNCRFLQGPLTDTAVVKRIRKGLESGDMINETLLNYRADGTAFWNHVVISPIFDPAGNLTHHVGVQSDVTERVDAEAARNSALERAEASSARQRAVAAVGESLANYLTSAEDLLADLPGLVVSHFDGWCAVIGLNTTDEFTDVAVAASLNRGRPAAFWRSEDDARRIVAEGQSRITQAIRDRGTVWPLLLTVRTQPDDHRDEVREFHALFSRITARGQLAGLLALVRPAGGFDDQDEVAAIADLATRAGTALDNTRMYSMERQTALTLQEGLLPTLPALDRFDVAASYIPASDATVGGDWYDVIKLPGPWIGAAVGDVIGHDMKAAAVMGQLRSMVRTLAWEGHRPAHLIAKLDALVRDLNATSFATVLYVLIDDPHPSRDDAIDTRWATYTSAGHLPAVLRRPDGSVTRLDQARTSPIGVADVRVVEEGRIAMPAGSVLVLYTDGLIERRDASLEDGFVALEQILRDSAPSFTAAEIRDAITSALVSPDHGDDTCVLVIRVG